MIIKTKRGDIQIDQSKQIETLDWYYDENKQKIKRYFESRESFPSLVHRHKIVASSFFLSKDIPKIEP